MDNDDAPTTYEIARIAATLLGREGAENPEKAAHAALNLWIASDSEIRKAIQPTDEEPIIKVQLSPDESGNSEAMEWVNTNLRGKFTKERFDDFEQFKKAWCKFNPSDAKKLKRKAGKRDPQGLATPITTDLDALMVFRHTLETRREDQLYTDAERNRNKRRAEKRPQNPSKQK